MSNVIRIKRSTSGAAVPSSLAFGELAYGAAGDLWIGAADGSIVKIGGVDVATQASVSAQIADVLATVNAADAGLQDAINAAVEGLAAQVENTFQGIDRQFQGVDSQFSSVDRQIGQIYDEISRVNTTLSDADAETRTYVDETRNALNGRINQLSSDVNTQLSDNRQMIADARQIASDLVTSEAAQRSAADDAIIAMITGESGTRSGAIDAALVDAKSYTDVKIAELVGQAPALLDTLAEIASALGQDPSLSTTLLNAIGNEEANRVSADAHLQTQIDGLSEITIPGLRALITNLESNLNTLVDTNAAEHATINAAVEETNRILWLTMGRVGDAENNIMLEQTNREAADTAINARIDALTTSLSDVTMDGGEF